MNPSDQIYIDTVRDQIKKGMYDHLFIYLKQDYTFVDIGANTGEVSKYFAKHAKRVIAIEPAPETFKQLIDNTKDVPNIECFNVALAPVDGEVQFYVNDINFTASSTVNTYGKQITVEGIRLSTLVHRFKVEENTLAKIDAEGAEGESLNLVELEKCKPFIDTYYVEVHNCPKTTWEHKLGTLVGNFARIGYTKMQIDGMSLTATIP